MVPGQDIPARRTARACKAITAARAPVSTDPVSMDKVHACDRTGLARNTVSRADPIIPVRPRDFMPEPIAPARRKVFIRDHADRDSKACRKVSSEDHADRGSKAHKPDRPNLARVNRKASIRDRVDHVKVRRKVFIRDHADRDSRARKPARRNVDHAKARRKVSNGDDADRGHKVHKPGHGDR